MGDVARTILFFILAVCFASNASATEYETDSEKLPADQKKLWSSAHEKLNNWKGRESKPLAEARKEIDKFLKLNDRFLPIYNDLARYQIMMSMIDKKNKEELQRKALKTLSDLHKKGPEYAKAYVNEAQFYIYLKDYANAERSLERAKKIGTTDPWLHLNWARMLRDQGFLGDALKHAQLVLEHPELNPKSMWCAIDLIDGLWGKVHDTRPPYNFPEIVSRRLNKQEERIGVARRLYDYYTPGNEGSSQYYAQEIARAELMSDPDCVECILIFAKSRLSNGMLYETNGIIKYSESSMNEVKKALQPMMNSLEAKNDVFWLLTSISLSRNNFRETQHYINRGMKIGVEMETLSVAQAKLYMAKQEYEFAVDVLEGLAKRNPSYKDYDLLLTAYALLGDSKKLLKHQQREVKKYPENAWVLGNYASILLYFKGDAKSAIRYGVKALSLKDYPMARRVTSIAYQVEAYKQWESGKKKKALSLYESALKLGVVYTYNNKECEPYCETIDKMRKIYLQTRKTEADPAI